MSKMIRIQVGLLLLLAWASQTPLWAQPYRENLVASPFQIFNTMRSQFDGEEYDKLLKSMKVLSPWVEAMERKEGIDLLREMEGAVASKSRERVEFNLRRLVVVDLSDLLNFGEDSRPLNDKEKMYLRTAVLEYNLISSEVQERSIQTDQRIKNNIKKMMILVNETGMVAEGVRGFAQAILNDIRPLAQLK